MANQMKRNGEVVREVKVMGKVLRSLTLKLEYVIIIIKELKMSTIP